jgi:ferritin-like metal-binding protein YciE
MSLKSGIKNAAKSLGSMEELLKEELQDMYDMESVIIDALPRMEKAVNSEELKQAFHQHLDTTKQQKTRLDKIFRMMNMSPEISRCDGIRGIISEGEVLINAKGKLSVKDAALVAAAQRVEHYEMAAYGCARSFAQHLGLSDIADILQQTLTEVGGTDHRLTRIAETGVNLSAAAR